MSASGVEFSPHLKVPRSILIQDGLIIRKLAYIKTIALLLVPLIHIQHLSAILNSRIVPPSVHAHRRIEIVTIVSAPISLVCDNYTEHTARLYAAQFDL